MAASLELHRKIAATAVFDALACNAASAGPHRIAAVDEPTPYEPTAVDLRDYVVFDPGQPVQRRVFATDVVGVDLMCLEPKQVMGARAFPTADVVYTVLGGRAWIVTDEAEATLDPLQSVMVPATVPHGVRNDSPDPLILQVVVSPPDEIPAPFGPPPTPHHPSKPRRSATDRLRRALGG
jgi:quercetin dioxygenase-like cupin family protein